MNRVRRVALAVFIFGAALTLGSQLAFPAFSSGNTNSGNLLSAGTVALSDDDGDAALFSLTDARGGVTTARCVSVVYGGSLDATVQLWATVSGALAPYVRLKVERGTSTSESPSCAGFSVNDIDHRGLGPGVLYDGSLDGFPGSAQSAIADPDDSWTKEEKRAYRFVATLDPDAAAQGLSASVVFTWKATNT